MPFEWFKKILKSNSIGIIASFFSILAAITSIKSCSDTKYYQELSVMPDISATLIVQSPDNSPPQIRISNNGPGLAKIYGIKIKYKGTLLNDNFDAEESWRRLVQQDMKVKCKVYYHGDMKVSIEPHDSTFLLQIEDNCSDEDKKIFVDALYNLSFQLKYKSLSGRNFIFPEDGSFWRETTCIPPSSERFSPVPSILKSPGPE